jgi:hypothetical protein
MACKDQVSRLSRAGPRLGGRCARVRARDHDRGPPSEAPADPAVLHRLVVAEEPGEGVVEHRARAVDWTIRERATARLLLLRQERFERCRRFR